MSRALRHLRVALVTLALTSAAACTRPEPDALPSVRLGMSPRDVRERFQAGGEGSWHTSVGADNDTILEWVAKDDAAAYRDARFEFHLGMLVAIRARAAQTEGGEQVSTTARTVTVRRPLAGDEGSGTSITVLARDCPTHKDEAERLAARSEH